MSSEHVGGVQMTDGCRTVLVENCDPYNSIHPISPFRYLLILSLFIATFSVTSSVHDTRLTNDGGSEYTVSVLGVTLT